MARPDDAAARQITAAMRTRRRRTSVERVGVDSTPPYVLICGSLHFDADWNVARSAHFFTIPRKAIRAMETVHGLGTTRLKKRLAEQGKENGKETVDSEGGG
jgi:hypothetical protein